MQKDNLKILGLKQGASEEEIGEAYRRLAHKYHPDKGGNPVKFLQLKDAYNSLMTKNSLIPRPDIGQGNIECEQYDTTRTRVIRTTEDRLKGYLQKNKETIQAKLEVRYNILVTIPLALAAFSADKVWIFPSAAVRTLFAGGALVLFILFLMDMYKLIWQKEKYIDEDKIMELLEPTEEK